MNQLYVRVGDKGGTMDAVEVGEVGDSREIDEAGEEGGERTRAATAGRRVARHGRS